LRIGKNKELKKKKKKRLPACYESTTATCSLTQSANAYVNISFTIELLSHSTPIFSTNKCSMSLTKKKKKKITKKGNYLLFRAYISASK
jgi:hypothetical protein